MDNANRLLLEQILEARPIQDVSLAAPLAKLQPVQDGNTFRLFIETLNRITKNKGFQTPLILSYDEQSDPAVLTFHPKNWRKQLGEFSPERLSVFQRSVADTFQYSGKTACNIVVQGYTVARIFACPLQGWVWESTGARPFTPPSAATILQSAFLFFLVIVLIAIWSH